MERGGDIVPVGRAAMTLGKVDPLAEDALLDRFVEVVEPELVHAAVLCDDDAELEARVVGKGGSEDRRCGRNAAFLEEFSSAVPHRIRALAKQLGAAKDMLALAAHTAPLSNGWPLSCGRA